jgi:hypothetical protein
VDWDSPLDLFWRVFPNTEPDAWEQSDAQAEVLRRFTKAFGAATVAEMSDWSGWNQRTISKLVDRLVAHRDIVSVGIEGETEEAHLASEDAEALKAGAPVSRFIVVLPTNDPFVMPQWSHLNLRHRPCPLPYCYGVIVVDGEIAGAAWGHYKRRYIHIKELRGCFKSIRPGSVTKRVRQAHLGFVISY